LAWGLCPAHEPLPRGEQPGVKKSRKIAEGSAPLKAVIILDFEGAERPSMRLRIGSPKSRRLRDERLAKAEKPDPASGETPENPLSSYPRTTHLPSAQKPPSAFSKRRF
jgi:hypothetical protein